jgi:uncharacterized membrane protein YbaN (DUF454 family)
MGPGMTSKIKAKAWTIAGSLFVGLGAVGLLVPVMPTTPFLLLAAGCYGRGSPRAQRWLMENRLFGKHIKSYQEGRGLNRKAKATSALAVVAGISFSIFYTGMNLIILAILIAVAAAVIFHILSLPNADRESN